MFLLDTNVCIGILNGSSSTLVDAFKSCQASEILLCSVVKAELHYGARHSTQVAQNLELLRIFSEPFNSLPFDDHSAEIYGQIRADLASAGAVIAPNDLMIAAIAKGSDVTLVTENVSEFSRVPGLKVIRWQED